MEWKKLLGVFAAALLLACGVSAVVFNLNLSHPMIQAAGCSNYPIVQPGDLILVQDTSFKEIEEGDTVIYRAGSEGLPNSIFRRSKGDITVIHQVVNKSEKSLQTKGKSNSEQLPFEKKVEPSQIWGTPLFKIRLPTGRGCF